ncbi:MAG: hypothetical protein HQL76_08275 [Magnetococcales bacterium]|nr:hypothetical protein [Magnetococcales bacterium]
MTMTPSAAPSPTPLDLFALARTNDPLLEQQFATHSSGTGANATALRDMSALVLKKGNVTVNMRFVTLHAFLSTNKLENIHEWAEKKAATYTREGQQSPAEWIRKKLSDNKDINELHTKRTRFEESFQRGHEFHYGALNIGGLGATKYGEICVVIDNRFWDRPFSPVAYLIGDSLKIFMNHENQLEETKLKTSIASHAQRHHLMALKHRPDLDSWPRQEWSKNVCSEMEYIEAIFVQPLTLPYVQEIRIKKSDYDRLYDLGSNNVSFGTLSEADMLLVSAFETVNTIMMRQNLEWKDIT